VEVLPVRGKLRRAPGEGDMPLRVPRLHQGEAPNPAQGEGDMTMANGNPNAGGKGLCLVLGCGDVGFAVARRLRCRGVEVAVVERDADKVEALRWQGYAAFPGDFGSPEVLKSAGVGGAGAVIITVRDFPTVKRALDAIGQLKAQLGISPLVLALVSDEAEVPEARRLGADEALSFNHIIADFVLGRLPLTEKSIRQKVEPE